MPYINNGYFQNYQTMMPPNQANSPHDYHIIEFEEMCKQMITSALQQHDEQIQVDVQTMLNGRPCSMQGLVSDIKRQITSALSKAFRR